MKMPSRRFKRRLKYATARPATAMPIVLAFTAKPIAAGVTSYALRERWQDRLRREQIDHGEERREPDHQCPNECAYRPGVSGMEGRRRSFVAGGRHGGCGV